jgi:hypothetical protein
MKPEIDHWKVTYHFNMMLLAVNSRSLLLTNSAMLLSQSKQGGAGAGSKFQADRYLENPFDLQQNGLLSFMSCSNFSQRNQ